MRVKCKCGNKLFKIIDSIKGLEVICHNCNTTFLGFAKKESDNHKK